MLKTCTTLFVGILERIYCFNKVFLMALISTEQLLWKDLSTDVSCIMITYPISSNLCKKISLQCYRLYISPSFRSNDWRRSDRKGVLRCWQNSLENTCGKVSSIKLQAEATASDLSRVFFWRFLVNSVSFQQENGVKKGNNLI